MQKITRCLVRETTVRDHGRPLLIELHPGYVIFRLKGTRQRYAIDWESLYRFAQRREAERVVAERYSKRKLRRHT
jgi:hypothetical protein